MSTGCSAGDDMRVNGQWRIGDNECHKKSERNRGCRQIIKKHLRGTINRQRTVSVSTFIDRGSLHPGSKHWTYKAAGPRILVQAMQLSNTKRVQWDSRLGIRYSWLCHVTTMPGQSSGLTCSKAQLNMCNTSRSTSQRAQYLTTNGCRQHTQTHSISPWIELVSWQASRPGSGPVVPLGSSVAASGATSVRRGGATVALCSLRSSREALAAVLGAVARVAQTVLVTVEVRLRLGSELADSLAVRTVNRS